MNSRHPYQPNTPEEEPINPPTVYVSESAVWEYKRLSRNLKSASPPTEEEMNELGKEGWDFVSSVIYADTLHFYFKRPTK